MKSAADIARDLNAVRAKLPQGVQLVAVSKFHPEEQLLAAYEQGQRLFGESHERELARKAEALPKDIHWHFIGHLQTNKVRHIAPYIDMIEAVDSIRLLREINKQAQRCQRIINVLIELHIAKEETKYGFSPDDCRQLFAQGEWRELQNVKICGLMMMASNVEDTQQIRREMTIAADLFDEIKAQHFASDPAFCQRSWGMSHDYPIAVECRSTLVRVGTAIFGEREYPEK